MTLTPNQLASKIVDFDKRDARAAAGATDLCRIGAGRERGNERRIATARGERKRADAAHEGRVVSGSPAVRAQQRALRVVETEHRLAECAGVGKRAKRGADRTKKDFLRRTGADDETGDQHVGAGADLGAGGKICEPIAKLHRPDLRRCECE